MSVASDNYEKEIAQSVEKSGFNVKKTASNSNYSDICIIKDNSEIWLEVKMNHTDNLGNPRVSYISGTWTSAFDKGTTTHCPVKKFAMKYLSENEQTKKFLNDIALFSRLDVENMIVSSLRKSLKEQNSVPHSTMAEYFKDKSQYILDVPNVDLGSIVSEHYLTGKKAPAYYMQAGDDFYIMNKNFNPLNVPDDVPDLTNCTGNFKMRVSIRSKFYEIQPEIKITDMPHSNYSLKPSTNKRNPFIL